MSGIISWHTGKAGPARDLPIEFPTKIEMVVNMNTAKPLGLTVPPSLPADYPIFGS
jgi:hypothetical protein